MAELRPAEVTKVLKKAGVRKSECHRSGQVRGWGRSTEGFQLVVQYGEKQDWKYPRRTRLGALPRGFMTTVTDTSKVLGITLEWVFGDWFRGDAEAREAERKKHFERMTAALRAAGYSVEDVTETQPNGVQRFLRIGIAVENPS